MNLTLTRKEGLVSPPFRCTPEVVITLSFQPVITPKSRIEQKLKEALEKTEQYILEHYTMQQAMPVFMRLQSVVNNLNFYTHKKGIAIFVSPAFEKVLYLDFEVEDNVHIDKDFKLLDIALHQKEEIKYLVLALQEDKACAYLGNEKGLQLVKENMRNRAPQISNLPQRSYPYTYLPTNVVDEYLLQVDQGLSLLVSSYPYPVFVVGEDKIVDRFISSTCNRHAIVLAGFLPDNKLTTEKLYRFMQPHLGRWNNIMHEHLQQKIERARCDNKLSWGSRSIWNTGIRQGVELIAEKGYEYPNRKFDKSYNLYNLPVAFNHQFYLADAADEIAEKVIEAGGKIHLVNTGSLSQYAHLVMLSR